MATQANVYTSASNISMYTDKVRIATGTSAVTYNVKIQDLSAGTFDDSLFSNPATIPANNSVDVFVGVGNRLTVTGSGMTIQEVGTASSGTASVY